MAINLQLTILLKSSILELAICAFKYKDCKKCERLNLEFYNGKPYINAKVKINHNEIPVKLLIDSGGSDALWLFEDDSLNIKPGDKFFNDFLNLLLAEISANLVIFCLN